MDAFDPASPDVSAAGLAFTCGWEGWVDHRYRDPIGLWTWGYGHLERPGDRENFPTDAQGRITKEFGTRLLHDDMQKCVRAVIAAVHPEILTLFSHHMFDALCDWLFNCGPGAIAVSRLLVHVNAGLFEYVPEDLCQWCKVTVNGVKQTHPGLLARRKRTGELWLSPDVLCPANVEPTRGIVPEIPDVDRYEYQQRTGLYLRREGWDLIEEGEHDVPDRLLDPH